MFWELEQSPETGMLLKDAAIVEYALLYGAGITVNAGTRLQSFLHLGLRQFFIPAAAIIACEMIHWSTTARIRTIFMLLQGFEQGCHLDSLPCLLRFVSQFKCRPVQQGVAHPVSLVLFYILIWQGNETRKTLTGLGRLWQRINGSIECFQHLF